MIRPRTLKSTEAWNDARVRQRGTPVKSTEHQKLRMLPFHLRTPFMAIAGSGEQICPRQRSNPITLQSTCSSDGVRCTESHLPQRFWREGWIPNKTLQKLGGTNPVIGISSDVTFVKLCEPVKLSLYRDPFAITEIDFVFTILYHALFPARSSWGTQTSPQESSQGLCWTAKKNRATSLRLGETFLNFSLKKQNQLNSYLSDYIYLATSKGLKLA